ncbi:hypothetical protein VAB18032_15510 [Micromonospora maris AB-18-032]|nr:hypothetical protein VAB18032_15510 [Micromonospora maris AB-18-032]
MIVAVLLLILLGGPVVMLAPFALAHVLNTETMPTKETLR